MDESQLYGKIRSGFFDQVWMIVRQVPAGKVTTYGQVAKYIPQPAGMSPQAFLAQRARWVGGAMAECPNDVPWQRVINAQGQISVRKGADEQRRLLMKEGIVFDERERVDLKRFGWEGPSVDWLKENGLVAPEASQGTLF